MCLVNSERLDIYLFLILHLLVRCGVNRIILSFSFIKIKEENDKINSFNIFSSITFLIFSPLNIDNNLKEL